MTGKRLGRPPIGDTALGRRTIYLTPDEVITASRAGEGNLSDGVRQLIREVVEYRAWFGRHMMDIPPYVEVPRRRKHQ